MNRPKSTLPSPEFVFALPRSDEELTSDKLALETACGGHAAGVNIINSVVKEIYLSIHPTEAVPQFLWKLIPSFFHFSLSCRCLKDFNTIRHGSPESSVSRRIFSDHWNVSQAPFAGDIIWEHLSVDNESWWVRAVLINTLLFIFVLFLTTPAVVLSTLQELEASVGEQFIFPNCLFLEKKKRRLSCLGLGDFIFNII